MPKQLTRKSIVKKMFQMSTVTLLSKLAGGIRDILSTRYLGVSGLSDAFFSAYRLPSSLRKIFAEGALNAAFVPNLVTTIKHDGKDQVSRAVTAMMIVMQAFLVPCCFFMAFKASTIISYILPGWGCSVALERCTLTSDLFHILIFFLALSSAGALLTGALQTVHSFSVPLIGQTIMNTLLIIEWWAYDHYGLPLTLIAWAILFNSVVFLLLLWFVYYRKGFRFLMPNREAWTTVWHAIKKFVPAAIVFGAVEICFLIDNAFASFLVVGSVSLLRYTYAFARIPLQTFANTFASILLPHFSRFGKRAPRRLSFYLFEAAKLIWWITIPATIFLIVFSNKILFTIFLSKNFTVVYVNETSILLSIFITGLFFFSFEKVILTTFYSLHDTVMPTVITLSAAALNTLLNAFAIYFWGLRGLLIATVFAQVVKVVAFLWVLKTRKQFVLYIKAFGYFVYRALLQLALVCWGLFFVYYACAFIVNHLPGRLSHLFMNTLLYWLWVGPLILATAIVMYFTRKQFKVKLYFLE